MYGQLFLTFLMLGFMSFGGGYALIPIIERMAVEKNWLTYQELSDFIAVAGMSPGPIAVNTAISVGYRVEGFMGAVVSAVGIIIPSLIIVMTLAYFFTKASGSSVMNSAFYGLRAVITAIIMYAGINFALRNGVIGMISWHSVGLLVIFGISLLLLIRFRWHPLFVILFSGVTGMLFYSN